MLIVRMFAIATAALVSAATPVLAQSSSGPDTRIGFGVALSNAADDFTAVSAAPAASVEVPIGVMTHLRVQPEFRYQRLHSTDSISTTLPGTPISQTTDTTVAATWFGSSVLYNTTTDRVGIYLGGKIGLVRAMQQNNASGTGITNAQSTSKTTGYFVGPVIGGEYYLHDRFSIGAAIAVIYQAVDYSSPSPPGVDRSRSQTAVQTRASFTARVYLR